MNESGNTGPELYFPALSGIYEKLTPYTWPLVRVTVGLMLVPHGWMKLFGGGLDGTAKFMAQIGLEPAYPLALYIALLELIGGAMLALGLFTRPIAVLVAGFMAVSALYVHGANGFLWIKGGFEYPLFWGLMAAVVAIRGGGPMSLDARMKREV
jgi:putative oxidoreductase